MNTDLQNCLNMVFKGNQDFSRYTSPENGNIRITVIVPGKANVHTHFDKDGNYLYSSAS